MTRSKASQQKPDNEVPMPETEQPLARLVGTFDFECFSTGKGSRSCCSHFQVRCDAVALHESEVLLLSLIGPETSLKALTAGFRSSGKDQKRFEYSVNLGGVQVTRLTKSPVGYRVYRTKLGYDLWHVLLITRRDGFIPAVSEESLWQHLQGPGFTTPLLRAWMPWLRKEMARRSLIVPLKQYGCEAGLAIMDTDGLDALVSEGLQKTHLAIGERSPIRRRKETPISLATIQSLDQYLTTYGALLGQQAERSLKPLHVPGQQPLPPLDLGRAPFEAQRHVIEAARRALRHQKSLLVVGEMGTGKTLMGMAAIHAHAGEQPYRALVFCPGQLVQKWEREIRETIPGVEVIQIESWKSLLHLKRTVKPKGSQWYIIARDRAKLGAKWRPSFHKPLHQNDGFLQCPQCGRRLVDEKREPVLPGNPGKEGQPGTGLWRKRSRCEWVLSGHEVDPGDEGRQPDQLAPGCGSPLWQMTGEIARYEPALYIKRRLKNFFRYLVLDEIHEEKGADTAQGHAAGALVAACQKVIALTGTLIGGYAEHLRPILFRLSPGSLVHEGMGWSDAMAFNERYGRIETRITERSGGRSESDNRMSRGSKATVKSVKPGIMPPLFGRHLIDKCVFLGLNEVAHNLPSLSEECVPVRMDPELNHAYRTQVEEPLAEAIKEMMRRRDRRLLGTFLQTLLAYPDYPFDWSTIGYWKNEAFLPVATPPNLATDIIRPKEQALIDLVRSEKSKGRKVWVYVQYTDAHDVQGRLKRLLEQEKFQVGVLQSTVPLARREEWIAKNA
jgi:hypothetical protein